VAIVIVRVEEVFQSNYDGQMSDRKKKLNQCSPESNEYESYRVERSHQQVDSLEGRRKGQYSNYENNSEEASCSATLLFDEGTNCCEDSCGQRCHKTMEGSSNSGSKLSRREYNGVVEVKMEPILHKEKKDR